MKKFKLDWSENFMKQERNFIEISIEINKVFFKKFKICIKIKQTNYYKNQSKNIMLKLWSRV